MIICPGKAELVHVILKASNRYQQCVVDLNVSIYMLVSFYKVYYPGMIQLEHVVLRWKRIQINPLQRYQSSKDLATMTLKVLERTRI